MDEDDLLDRALFKGNGSDDEAVDDTFEDVLNDVNDEIYGEEDYFDQELEALKRSGSGGSDEEYENDDMDLDFKGEDEEEVSDDEITNLLDSTREARQNLKTGDAEEMLRDFQDFEDNLIATSGIGKTRHGKKRRVTQGEARMPKDAREMLTRANGLYIDRKHGEAISLLQEIIRKHPFLYQAWNTLGLVHSEIGNPDKSLRFRMVAAHMSDRDPELWKELGVKSIENNAVRQGLYCFTKALILNPVDVDALWDRSYVYKKEGETDKALQGFEQILKLIPHHLKVINEVVQIYRKKGRTKEAIALYEAAIDHHARLAEKGEDEAVAAADEDEEEAEEADEFMDKLGYTEVNMLSELYLMENQYERALQCIKTGVRYVQHRQHENEWEDHHDDDDEYFGDLRDDDEEVDEEVKERCDFPIELRVRMGVCRVYMGDVKIASRHFEYLLRFDGLPYPDLHQDIAYAYMDKRHYDLALSVFQKIIDSANEVEIDLLLRAAECYHEVGELETAVVFYVNVLEEQPDNLSCMMALATVYEEQGREEQALELVDFVMKRNRELRQAKRTQERQQRVQIEDDEAEGKHEVSLFDEKKKKTESIAAYYQRKREERIAAYHEEERHTLSEYARLMEVDELLGPDIVGADRSLIREYTRIAEGLCETFLRTRAFFPVTRWKRFNGFYAARSKRSKEPTHQEANQMARRLRERTGIAATGGEYKLDSEDEEDIVQREEEERQEQIHATSHFHGIHFSDWMRIFIKYGYMLAQSRPAEHAYDVLKKALEANVFYHDPDMKLSLKLALLGCAMINGNEIIVTEVIRWFCMTYAVRQDPYRLYAASIPSSISGAKYFSSSSSLKFVTRQVRLHDAILACNQGNTTPETNTENMAKLNEAIEGAEVDPETNEKEQLRQFYTAPTDHELAMARDLIAQGVKPPTSANQSLLGLLATLLSTGRNNLSASLFFLRSLANVPNDPLTCLGLSVCLIQFSAHKFVTDRHTPIAQAVGFFTEYYKSRPNTQEAEYNMGRLFHTIGLGHLAVHHYERALCLPSKAKEGKVPPKDMSQIYVLPDDLYDDDGPDDMEEDDYDDTDLTMDAAYNLHHIYITSGATELARIVIDKYCVV